MSFSFVLLGYVLYLLFYFIYLLYFICYVLYKDSVVLVILVCKFTCWRIYINKIKIMEYDVRQVVVSQSTIERLFFFQQIWFPCPTHGCVGFLWAGPVVQPPKVRLPVGKDGIFFNTLLF